MIKNERTVKRYETMTKEEIMDVVKSCCVADILGTEICSKVSFEKCMSIAHKCGLCAIDYLNEEIKENKNETY